MVGLKLAVFLIDPDLNLVGQLGVDTPAINGAAPSRQPREVGAEGSRRDYAGDAVHRYEVTDLDQQIVRIDHQIGE